MGRGNGRHDYKYHGISSRGCHTIPEKKTLSNIFHVIAHLSNPLVCSSFEHVTKCDVVLPFSSCTPTQIVIVIFLVYLHACALDTSYEDDSGLRWLFCVSPTAVL